MEWIKKNKKIVIGVLVVVVLVCVGVGAYFVSGNGEPKKANKENTEKTVEKQEDSNEVQDEEEATENVDNETVVDETTQTESDEVTEETPTGTTQPSVSANDTTSDSNSTTNNNTTSGNTTNTNLASNNTTNSGNSDSATTDNSNNTNSSSNSGSTNSGNPTSDYIDNYKKEYFNYHGEHPSPARIAALEAGYYNVAEYSDYYNDYGYLMSGGYAVLVRGDECTKGYQILVDYLANLGYELYNGGGSGAWIDSDLDYYGVYADYDQIRKIVPIEDESSWR